MVLGMSRLPILLDFWISGSLDVWISGCLNVQMSGFLIGHFLYDLQYCTAQRRASDTWCATQVYKCTGKHGVPPRCTGKHGVPPRCTSLEVYMLCHVVLCTCCDQTKVFSSPSPGPCRRSPGASRAWGREARYWRRRCPGCGPPWARAWTHTTQHSWDVGHHRPVPRHIRLNTITVLLSHPFKTGVLGKSPIFFYDFACLFVILSIFYVNSPIYVVCYIKPHKFQFRFPWPRDG